MKPEAQVPSEASLFQSSCLPSLCVACPHNSRDCGGGGEGFFFSASSQVQLEAADGPGSGPNRLRYSDPHNCRDRVHSLLGSLLWKVERSLPPALWRSEQRHATFPVSLSPLCREQRLFKKKNPFYLLNTTVHFRCTFFSNSCELMAKKKKTPTHSPALSCVCAKGPWAEGMGLAGPCCPTCRVLRGGCAPFPS